MNRRNVSIFIIFMLTCFVNINVLHAQNTTDINQQLQQAIMDGNSEQVEALMSQGANLNATNQLGWTPLHTAIRTGKSEIAQILINRGANVNARDNTGQTPLHFAIESGMKSIILVLTERVDDINAMNNQGDNALSLAQKTGQTVIANDLAQQGATMPGASNQPQMNRRGMNRGSGNFPGNQFPDMSNMRRGGPQGNDINPNSAISDQAPNIQMPDNMDILGGQVVPEQVTEISLDPNEVKARVQTFEGLAKAVEDVASKSRAGMRQWRRIQEDNRHLLVSAVRRQYEAEVTFIKDVAVEESAKNTADTADNLLSIRKERFRIITREVRDEVEQQQRQTRTTNTSSRRGSARTTTTTTRTRGRSATNLPVTTQIVDMANPADQEEESRYDAETQSELNQWINANVETIDGRIDLMNTMNDLVATDFNSLKQLATEEDAKKTIAAIDGLLIARQERFLELEKDLQEELQEQQGTTMQYMPDANPSGDQMNTPTTGRRRGR